MPYWVDYRKLPSSITKLIEFDDAYESQEGSLRDAAYQAWQKGFIAKEVGLRKEFVGNVSVADEYRFVKKYFNPFWLLYVFVVRLLTLNNPFIELRGVLKALSVPRISLYANVYDWSSFDVFNSPLLTSHPLVSIVIPTLNRYRYLRDVLNDIRDQDYKNVEVIVVDQSDPFDADFYKEWQFALRVIRQEERALWMARNTAISLAKGSLVLLYDDDSRVSPDWIRQHIRCLDYFKADYSAGVSLSVVGSQIPKNYSFFRWADQIDTGNVMLRREMFVQLGLFDRQFERQRMGDGEFGLRAYLHGLVGISNPRASRIHLKVESGGLRQMGSWDGFRPTSVFAPRPIPSVLYLTRRYFGLRATLFDLLIKLPMSVMPFKYKRTPSLLVLGYLVSLFMAPVLLIQLLRAWRKSTGMIDRGPQIDHLPSIN